MTYEPVLQSDPLVAQVWAVMQDYKGYEHRIDRTRLTCIVLNWATDNNDRKVRDALAELPVIWQDGYFIPANQAEADAYIASMRSRQASIGQRLRVLDDYLRQTRDPARQMTLNEAMR